jgi:hypothetical protein
VQRKNEGWRHDPSWRLSWSLLFPIVAPCLWTHVQVRVPSGCLSSLTTTQPSTARSQSSPGPARNQGPLLHLVGVPFPHGENRILHIEWIHCPRVSKSTTGLTVPLWSETLPCPVTSPSRDLPPLFILSSGFLSMQECKDIFPL